VLGRSAFAPRLKAPANQSLHPTASASRLFGKGNGTYGIFEPNDLLLLTGHANDGVSCFVGNSRVSRQQSGLFGLGGSAMSLTSGRGVVLRLTALGGSRFREVARAL
jgi:hypothetical protein